MYLLISSFKAFVTRISFTHIMYYSSALLVAALAGSTNAYAWMADMEKSEAAARLEMEKRAAAVATCPIHLTRNGAAPYSNYYPSQYTGAENGLPGTGKGGVLVPAAGDTAHAYTAPSSTDIRGPCVSLLFSIGISNAA